MKYDNEEDCIDGWKIRECSEEAYKCYTRVKGKYLHLHHFLIAGEQIFVKQMAQPLEDA